MRYTEDMKSILIFFLACASLLISVPAYTQEEPAEGATVESSVAGNLTSNVSSNFQNELTFVETFLESNYILALGLIVAVMGFWQFFVHGKGFGIVMIILAVGLTAFPGVYKGFYNSTRTFVNHGAGASSTQEWN